MIRGRVIRIFDRRTLVLNIGAADGVQPGMRFAIYTPREDIVDPESQENLGTYRLRKATVVAQTVSQRFTVAAAATVTRRVGGASLTGSLSALMGQVEEVEVDLPVDSAEIEPLGASRHVLVGDTVEEIQSRPTARATSQSPAIPSPTPSSSDPPKDPSGDPPKDTPTA
jgi:hypothetical protein